MDDVAQPFVGGRALVGGGGGRGEPALVDAAAVGPERVEVLRGQLEPAARHQERARHPGRGEPQDALAGFERRAGPQRCSDRSSFALSLAWISGHSSTISRGILDLDDIFAISGFRIGRCNSRTGPKQAKSRQSGRLRSPCNSLDSCDWDGKIPGLTGSHPAPNSRHRATRKIIPRLRPRVSPRKDNPRYSVKLRNLEKIVWCCRTTSLLVPVRISLGILAKMNEFVRKFYPASMTSRSGARQRSGIGPRQSRKEPEPRPWRQSCCSRSLEVRRTNRFGFR